MTKTHNKMFQNSKYSGPTCDPSGRGHVAGEHGMGIGSTYIGRLGLFNYSFAEKEERRAERNTERIHSYELANRGEGIFFISKIRVLSQNYQLV